MAALVAPGYCSVCGKKRKRILFLLHPVRVGAREEVYFICFPCRHQNCQWEETEFQKHGI